MWMLWTRPLRSTKSRPGNVLLRTLPTVRVLLCECGGVSCCDDHARCESGATPPLLVLLLLFEMHATQRHSAQLTL